jgi:hypothetical protein
MENNDILIIRHLAEQYAEIARLPIQDERRELWRKHNSLQKTRIPILCSWYWGSLTDSTLLAEQLACKDPFYRGYEHWLRNMIYHTHIGDDTIFEPWITIRAVLKTPTQCRNGNVWGIPYERDVISDTSAWIIRPTISSHSLVEQMIAAPHAIDEAETARRVNRLQEAVDGVLEVNVDRAPFYQCYGGSDLCEALGYLVGMENLMVLLHDKPELVHEIVNFMQKAVLIQYRQAEAAGDWSLTNNFNMGMPYSMELPDPRPNSHGAPMKNLWFFTCAQAFTLVSPRMFEEFMLDYQLPIINQFGLVSYACCEDMTHKIKSIRRIPNLRRIGVTPVSNVRKCAEQIGTDYVLSWKPNPSMICAGFERDDIYKTIRAGLEDSRGCIVDIMLKDISTIQGQPERLKHWTDIVRSVADDFV